MNDRKSDFRSRACHRLFLALLLIAAAIAPAGLASADENVYIRSGQSNLTVFDTKNFTPVGNIQLAGTSLWGLTTSPATRRLYAFDINTQTVQVIDAVSNTMIDTISLAALHFTPRGMATSADGKRLYFAAENRDLGLIALDLERGILMGEFAVPKAWRVVPHPTLDRLWVTTRYGELYTVRASDMAILGHQQLQGAEIALSSDGGKLYLTGDRGNLLVIDTATGQQVGTLPVPFHPDFIAVSERWAYLGNSEKGVLGVVDLADGHVEAEIALDAGQYVRVGGIDVTGDGSRVVVLLDNDLHYKYAVVDGVNQTLLSLHDGVAGALICSSKFIMAVQPKKSSFTVNTAADATDASPGDGVCETDAGNGICTLRAAVQEANATSGTGIIELPAGEYLLAIPGADEDQAATGDLDVLGNLTIRGAGRETTVIDAAALDRALEVGAAGLLQLQGVTVRNGHLAWRDPLLFTNSAGAGILNNGVLTMSGVAMLDNSTDGFGGAGVDSQGVLRADNCTFRGNLSKGTIFFYDFFGNVHYQESRGYGAIFARQAEVTGCLVTGNTGLVAVRIDGLLADSEVSGNNARGVAATSVSRSTISGNHGLGCSAASIEDSTISDNVNEEPDGCGGGVYWVDSYEQLVISGSTISGNSAARGGGICAKYIALSNSTVSNNAATGDGGGIYLQDYDVWGSIGNCTITANTADSDTDGFGSGGGIFSAQLSTYYDTHLANTVLAGNSDPDGQAPDCSGYLGSSQFNLVGNMSGCGFTALEWDITGSAGAPVDPGLGPLEDNGGLTKTHALLAGSPAIDAGHPYIFPTTDQRGFARPRDGNYDGVVYSDIGAFELQPRSFWTITASAGTGGSISPAGPVNVLAGGSQNFIIAANEHYHLVDVLVDGVSVGPISSWSFDEVNADHTIAASFAIDTYTVTASAGTGGSVSPAGITVVPYGGSLTVHVKPKPGYRVINLTVDGRNLGPQKSFTISGCSSDHVIRATFRRI